MLSFDIKYGYRNFCLHPDMSNYSQFQYEGTVYRYKALLFG